MSVTPFKRLLEKAVEVTTQKLADFPKYGVYIHAMKQLTFIQSIIIQGKAPTQSDKESINLGLMAVRELEATDPDYCDMLCEVDDAFKKL